MPCTWAASPCCGLCGAMTSHAAPPSAPTPSPPSSGPSGRLWPRPNLTPRKSSPLTHHKRLPTSRKGMSGPSLREAIHRPVARLPRSLDYVIVARYGLDATHLLPRSFAHLKACFPWLKIGEVLPGIYLAGRSSSTTSPRPHS
jgi:hypothetical protein